MPIKCDVVIGDEVTGVVTEHIFDSVPRLGDVIFIMANGREDMFRVVNVHHFGQHTPNTPSSAATQLIVTRELIYAHRT